jgi:hypothetical protein
MGGAVKGLTMNADNATAEILVRRLPDGNYQAYRLWSLSMPFGPDQLMLEVQQWQNGKFVVTIEGDAEIAMKM